ncbi:hypothetical protein HOP50_05g36390 [Chloropicon primus]|uniref:Uncharacterized protein n=1 Tax=Chloropicon primus TaxID=1764295 RepID=A0A5B8MLD5_9CHLO|nr:hypothetical protein A3770_05p36290 [Chloropicon primus]UPR00325.1 hypothetical protein HOP50_05g36390 [Chloropicon primus]|eukprot:QDZ21111.1 hypothetical protein A3770_05p36290 [Chloropicon primus]
MSRKKAFCDDFAMQPLKVLGEENRRKSAPPNGFFTVLGDDSKEWRIGDEENRRDKYVDDEESMQSFLSGDTDSLLDRQMETYAYASHRDSRRIGHWQGKVEYALRRSIALDMHDMAMSAVDSPTRNPPRIQRSRSRRLLQSMSIAVERSRDLSFYEKQNLNQLLGRQGEDIQGLKAKMKKMDDYIHKAEVKSAQEVSSYQEKHGQALRANAELRSLLSDREEKMNALLTENAAQEERCNEALRDKEHLYAMLQERDEEAQALKSQAAQHRSDLQQALTDKGSLEVLLLKSGEEIQALKSQASKHQGDLQHAFSEKEDLGRLLLELEEQVQALQANIAAHEQQRQESLEQKGQLDAMLKDSDQKAKALESQNQSHQHDLQQALQEKGYLKSLLLKREEEMQGMQARLHAQDATLQNRTAAGSGVAQTCALALLTKVDTLVQEKDELRALLHSLWARTQELMDVPAL